MLPNNTFSLESGSSPITQRIKTRNEMSFKIIRPIGIKMNHLGLDPGIETQQ